jgi:hypothetical protein
MIKTIDFTTEVTTDREIYVRLPEDIPAGPTRFLIFLMSSEEKSLKTLGDLLNSEFFGMWKDRSDITDSPDYARQLRQQAWSRVQ